MSDTLTRTPTEARRAAQTRIQTLRGEPSTPEVERELAQAHGDLRKASIDRYNELVAQQRALNATIEQAVDSLVKALADKETMAYQQKVLQTEDGTGTSYPALAVVDVRQSLIDQILTRLKLQPATSRRDWTSRLAQAGGNLEE